MKRSRDMRARILKRDREQNVPGVERFDTSFCYFGMILHAYNALENATGCECCPKFLENFSGYDIRNIKEAVLARAQLRCGGKAYFTGAYKTIEGIAGKRRILAELPIQREISLWHFAWLLRNQAHRCGHLYDGLLDPSAYNIAFIRNKKGVVITAYAYYHTGFELWYVNVGWPVGGMSGMPCFIYPA
jgi:hypothetical protein